MKIETRDNKAARKVLTGMIVSTPVVAAVAAKWESGLFPSRVENLVGGWCVKHYRKYGKAPGREIESVFDHWNTEARDPDQVQMIESLLAGLSGQYERRRKEINPDYLIDLAGEFFTEVKLRELKDEIEGRLEAGEAPLALELVRRFNGVDVNRRNSGYDVFKDVKIMKSAFEAKGVPLFSWDDVSLDRFFAPCNYRGEFVVLMGKAKIGKSFYLQELALRAARDGVRVAFFEVGDQTRDQLIRRIGGRAAGRPVKAQAGVKIPTSLEILGGEPRVQHKTRTWKTDLDGEEAADALAGFAKPDSLRLSFHPSRSLTVSGLEVTLNEWERTEDWVPNVVVIDYLDLMAPADAKMQPRDQVNQIWSDLRGLNQRRDVLLIGATQANRESYAKSGNLTMDNFSEDRRKNDHVTAMIGINQSPPDRKQGVIRLNFLLGRDLDFDSESVLYCAGCLALGNPAMFASF